MRFIELRMKHLWLHLCPLICFNSSLVPTAFSFRSVIFDGILMVLLSLEDVQMMHLKISLSDIVDLIRVNSEGAVMLSNKINMVAEGVPTEMEDRFHRLEPGMEIPTKEVNKLLLLWISHHQQLIRYDLPRVFGLKNPRKK